MLEFWWAQETFSKSVEQLESEFGPFIPKTNCQKYSNMTYIATAVSDSPSLFSHICTVN
jgi:hypothetical protein